MTLSNNKTSAKHPIILKDLFKKIGGLVQHPVLETLQISLQDPLDSCSQEEFQKKLQHNLNFLKEKIDLFEEAFSISSEDSEKHIQELIKSSPDIAQQIQAIQAMASGYENTTQAALKSQQFGLPNRNKGSAKEKRRKHWIRCD